MNHRAKFGDFSSRVFAFARQAARHEFALVSMFLAVFIVLFFSPTLIRGQLPLSSSYILQMYPWAYYRNQYPAGAITNNVLSDEYDALIPNEGFAFTEMRHGTYPLWNPYEVGGIPYGTLFINDSFSISRPLIILLGVQWGNLAYIFLKLYAVGVFAYFYLRYRGFNWAAALSSSLVLMFSANMIANAMRHTADSVVYAPAILYFAERFIRERRYGYFVGLAVAVAVTVISGYPAVTMYTLLLIAAYLAYRTLMELRDQPFRRRVQNLFLLSLAFAGGALLSAFTVVPTYEFVHWINFGERGGRGPAKLALIFAGRLMNPNMCGNPTQGGWFCGSNYSEAAVYVGLLPLMLIPFSLTNARHRRTAWFFFVSGLLILMTLFGVASLNTLVGNLPLFSLNPNTRMVALLPICFAFITATGIDQLTRVGRNGLWFLLFVAVLAGCAIYAFRIVPGEIAAARQHWDYFAHQRLLTLVLLGGYSLIAAILILVRGKARNLGLVALVVLGFVESAVLLGGYEGASYASSFYPETAATTFLETKMSNYERVLVLGRHFVPSLPLYYSINSLTGHSLAMVAFKQNMNLIQPGLYRGFQTLPIFASSLIDFTSPLLDLYRVRYVATAPSDEAPWFVSMADQKEYNQTYQLRKITSFGQSMNVTRDGYGGFLRVRLGGSLEDNLAASLAAYINERLVTRTDIELTRQDNGWYSIALPRLAFTKGQVVRFEIELQGAPLTKDAVIYGVKSNIYPGGSLFIDGKPAAGDLAFYLGRYDPVIAAKYRLVHSGDMNLYENESVNDIVPVVTQLRYADQAACAATLGGIDPRQEAVVNDPGLSLVGDATGSTARIREGTANSVVLEADIRQATSMVILSDSYYPGWQAAVDGTPAKIYLVNCAMRGVLVAPGKHVITMTYRPFSLLLGLGISLLTCIFLGIGGVVIMRRVRRTVHNQG